MNIQAHISLLRVHVPCKCMQVQAKFVRLHPTTCARLAVRRRFGACHQPWLFSYYVVACKSEGCSIPPGSMRHACVTCGAISRKSWDTISTGRSCFNLPAFCVGGCTRMISVSYMFMSTCCHVPSCALHIPSNCATSARDCQSSPANGSSNSSNRGCRHSCTANATLLFVHIAAHL